MRPGSVVAARYKIVAPLGQGAHTEVFHAHDLVLARSVALKLLRTGHSKQAGDFLDAAKRAAQLTHPNVAAVYDTGRHGTGSRGRPFLVGELCEGAVDAGHEWEVGTAAGIGARVAKALEHAHAQGIHHGHLVASNVFVGAEGTVKVTDTSISAAIEGREVNPLEDVQALAQLVYGMLTGSPPSDPALPLRALRPGLPRYLEDSLSSAIEGSRTLEQLGQALEAAETPGQSRSDATPPARRPGTSSKAVWVMAAAATAVVLLAIALIPRSSEEPGADRAGEGRADRATPIRIRSVDDFDPGGDDEEHGELVDAIRDGDLASTWHSETYRGTLAQVKPDHPGVGLVVDLGRVVTVSRVQIHSPTPGYALELLSASRPRTDEDSWAPVATIERAIREADVDDFEPVAARYWLLWITSLPGGGSGRIEIAEVRFFGA